MDGDIAPLDDMAALAEQYDAMLMVDDAHATGILGENGRGTAEHFGIDGRVTVQMGTLGKAFGSFGAYAAGSRSLIAYLVNRARSYIYSTALPPSICAASIAAIGIVEHEPALRHKLHMNRKCLVDKLKKIGIDTGNSESPIMPIMIGTSEQALKTASGLFECGVYATAIRPPTVPSGTARIRMTITAGHADEDIDFVIKALMTCRKEGLL
jgi:glycine C-acetyltransferase/8-amino-7-oxononanoate synthase